MEKGRPWETYHPEWKKLGEEIFAFLIKDFGCSLTERNQDGGLWLIFNNRKTHVSILFDPHDPGVSVRLGADGEKRDFGLLDLVTAQGEKIRYPKTGFSEFLKKGDSQETVEVDYQKSLQCESIGQDEKRLREVLNEYARLLLKYGTSVLKGDHSIFKEIEKSESKKTN